MKCRCHCLSGVLYLPSIQYVRLGDSQGLTRLFTRIWQKALFAGSLGILGLFLEWELIF